LRYSVAVDGVAGSDGRDWLAQARRGVIELCVLILIGKNPYYGYELAIALSHWQPLAAPEGTLYPMLRRLQRASIVDAKWLETHDGPPRKYYHLTPAGQRLLDSKLAEWEELTRSVGYLRAGIFDPNDTDAVVDPPDEEVPNGSGSHRQSALPGRAAPPSRARARS
jgi:PadR family transcriptional regulator PadR